MKLWLAKRFGGAGGMASSLAATGHSLGKTVSIESLEHVMRSRVKMFLRHTWLVTILGTILLGGALWAGFYFTTKATVMRIAAGPPGSANAKLAEVLSQKFARDRAKVQLEVVSTAGSRASAQAMAHDQADLAILPSTIGNSPDWPVVAILRQNVMAFIVPAPAANAAATAKQGTKVPASAKKAKSAKSAKSAKAATSSKGAKTTKSAKSAKASKGAKSDDGDDSDDSDATDSGKFAKVAQLAGRRIGIVTGNVATPELLNVVLDHYGVPIAQVQVSSIDPKDLADAIHANKVDVLFVAGAATGAAINDAVAAASQNDAAPSFIEIDQADGIAKRDPAFDSIDIDAGTFGGSPPTPDDSLKSLSFPEYLVARRSFSHNGIATLARLIYSSRLALAAEMPGEVKIEAPSTDKDAAVNVHPGALAYLTDSQQSFFDKYGDDIFYGMLIFPVFGSAIAGVATYFRNDGRTRRLRLLQRVLDLVRKAHAAQSLEAIEQIQIDADNLVITIIHHSEHEEFDESVRMSFSFVLDQLRFALAARRTAILDRIGGSSKAAAA
jgi:TRAP-type uncharacterized transport system substrate-binding protein